LILKDLDIGGAFLNANYYSPLGTVLYMRLPTIPGDLPGTFHPLSGKVVRLKKALYGLPESNMLFEQLRNKAVEKAGFKPIPTDASIFRKTGKGSNSILFIHVDDFQLISNNNDDWLLLLKCLKETFKDLEINNESTQHVGINVIQSKLLPGVFMQNQSGYIRKVVEDLKVLKSATVPSDIKLFNKEADEVPFVDIKFYQKLIGILIYSLATRGDIRKEVIYLASKSHAPSNVDMEKVTRVFSYLKATPDIGPIFDGKEAVLYGYSDASHNIHHDGRSHAGSFVCIGKNSAAIATHSRRITSCVALSSMEAEYIALNELSRTIIYMRNFLADIGFKQKDPTIIYEDNASAIYLASSSNIPVKSRHILLRYHFIKFAIESGAIEVHYVPSNMQRADCLTKALGPSDYLLGRSNLLNLSNESLF